MDKVNVSNPSQRRAFFKGYKDKTGGFASFVKYVKGVHERDIAPTNNKPPFLNDHYMLQSDKCFLPQGLRYNYYLKVEHMPVWYPFLINLLGLQKTASSGWTNSNSHNSNPNLNNNSSSHDNSTTITVTTTTVTLVTTTIIEAGVATTSSSESTDTTTSTTAPSYDCFYAPPGESCPLLPLSNPCSLPPYPLTSAQLLDESSFTGRSLAAMRVFYSSPEIAQDVTAFAQQDLDTFGYQPWDGIDVLAYANDVVRADERANCSLLNQST
jgi:hypothetical protein